MTVERKGSPTVVTFSGKARSGKDTCAFILKEKAESEGKKVLIVAYADMLKAICARNFVYNSKEEHRDILQVFGTEVCRGANERIWIDVVYQIFDSLRFEYDMFIIPDCRFENELMPSPYYLTYPIINVIVEREVGNDDNIDREHSSESMANNPDLTKFEFIVSNDRDMQYLIAQIEEMYKIITTELEEKIIAEQRGYADLLESEVAKYNELLEESEEV